MKINLIYTAALAASIGGLMAAGGIDTATTLGGMLEYAALALGMWGTALMLLGWGNSLEQDEPHLKHTCNRHPEYMQLPEHTEKKGA